MSVVTETERGTKLFSMSVSVSAVFPCEEKQQCLREVFIYWPTENDNYSKEYESHIFVQIVGNVALN